MATRKMTPAQKRASWKLNTNTFIETNRNIVNGRSFPSEKALPSAVVVAAAKYCMKEDAYKTLKKRPVAIAKKVDAMIGYCKRVLDMDRRPYPQSLNHPFWIDMYAEYNKVNVHVLRKDTASGFRGMQIESLIPEWTSVIDKERPHVFIWRKPSSEELSITMPSGKEQFHVVSQLDRLLKNDFKYFRYCLKCLKTCYAKHPCEPISRMGGHRAFDFDKEPSDFEYRPYLDEVKNMFRKYERSINPQPVHTCMTKGMAYHKFWGSPDFNPYEIFGEGCDSDTFRDDVTISKKRKCVVDVDESPSEKLKQDNDVDAILVAALERKRAKLNAFFEKKRLLENRERYTSGPIFTDENGTTYCTNYLGEVVCRTDQIDEFKAKLR